MIKPKREDKEVQSDPILIHINILRFNFGRFDALKWNKLFVYTESK